jgi:chemotaxis protein CheX
MKTLDHAKVTDAVRVATREVFSMMMGLEVEAEPAYEEAHSTGTVDGVVALIGLAGQWAGGGVLQCDAVLARKFYSSLLMTECEPSSDGVNEEVLDAVAEIANMIIGNVKNAIERDLGPIGLGIPSVVYGRNFTTRSAGSNWIVTPFVCDGGRMLVKFCLTPPSGAAAAAELLGREFPRSKHPSTA